MRSERPASLKNDVCLKGTITHQGGILLDDYLIYEKGRSFFLVFCFLFVLIEGLHQQIVDGSQLIFVFHGNE